MATTANRIRDHQSSFVWMAAVCIAIPLIGFAPTYWLQLPAATVVATPSLHVHAIVFAAWPIFFFVQAWLASTQRLVRHRAWGMAGISLATTLVVVGLYSAVHQLEQNIANGYGVAAKEFALLPVSGILLFAALFGASIAALAKPDFHKRLMLLATLALMQPAVARFFFAFAVGIGPGLRPGVTAPPPVAIALVPGLVVDFLIAIVLIHDWRSRGRLHPAYAIGGGLILGVQFLVLPMSASSFWHGFADYLVAFD